ncbi:MAG: hypothetical protein JWN94_4019 [Betaproteobacteria bacterium]|nr:hypothetical protein [Betaproteobacteria bacterium]
MLIIDMIRDADTDHEVYFWMTAYIESVKYGDALGLLPERITRLPLAGARDVRERFDGLIIDVDQASRQLNDRSCVVLKEALHVLGAGIARLKVLENAHRESLAQAMRSLTEKQRAAPPHAVHAKTSGAPGNELHP